MLLVLGFDGSIADNSDVGLCLVVADEVFFYGSLVEDDPVASLDGSSVAGAVLLGGHLAVELLCVGLKAVLAEDELGKVERESVCVVKIEGHFAAYCLLTGFLGLLHD